MGKVCIACGNVPTAPKKTDNQPEDCPNCDGKETVKTAPPKESPKE